MKYIIQFMTVMLGLFACTLSAQEIEGPEPIDKEELSGIVHTLPSEEFINVTIKENKFNIEFYDAEGLPIPPTYNEAIIRYEGVLHKETEGQMLCKSDGVKLVATRPLFPPHVFWVYIILKSNDDSERYTVSRSRLDMRESEEEN